MYVSVLMTKSIIKILMISLDFMLTMQMGCLLGPQSYFLKLVLRLYKVNL